MPLAIALLGLPASANAHPEPPYCNVVSEPSTPVCCCTPVQTEPSTPVAETKPEPRTDSLVASLETALGLGNVLVAIGSDGEQLIGLEQDVGPLLSLTPALEWRWGRYLFGGVEWTFASIDDAITLGGRRSVSVPMLRARLTFPVWGDWSAEGVFGVGVALWSAGPGGSSLYGWSRRWEIGAAYELTDDFAAFAGVGNVLLQASPAGKGPLSEQYDRIQPVGEASITLGLGIRAKL